MDGYKLIRCTLPQLLHLTIVYVATFTYKPIYLNSN